MVIPPALAAMQATYERDTTALRGLSEAKNERGETTSCRSA
jgi:hypothetical protein